MKKVILVDYCGHMLLADLDHQIAETNKSQTVRPTIEARTFVLSIYPEARAVVTRDTTWIQSEPGGPVISRAYHLREHRDECERLAWNSAQTKLTLQRRNQ
jgi:hypothetical protein